jgi:hypothetical protein
MVPLKVAYITTTPTDAAPLVSALECLKYKFGEVFQVQSLTLIPQLIASPVSDEFIQFAKRSHIVIMHVMNDFPEFAQLVSELKNAGVPIFAGASFFAENQKYIDVSTVEPEDYKKKSSCTSTITVKKTSKTFYYSCPIGLLAPATK